MSCSLPHISYNPHICYNCLPRITRAALRNTLRADSVLENPGYHTLYHMLNGSYASPCRPCSPFPIICFTCLEAHFKHTMHQKNRWQCFAIALKDWQSIMDSLYSPVVGESTIAESRRCSIRGSAAASDAICRE